MKKFFIFPLILLVFLNGCSVEKSGEDLTGFVLRANEKNEAYNLTENGFLYSEENDSFSKFFNINENELLLSFKTDEKSRLTEMNIVTENDFYSDETTLKFTTDLLYSFINNENTSAKIISESDFYNVIKEKTTDTKKTEIDNIRLLIDVTEIGCVITVYKDI